jgi:hypothetical protein
LKTVNINIIAQLWIILLSKVLIDHSIGGFVSSPMFLDCHGWKQQKQDSSQTDCETYSDDGELNYANRYDIKESSHNSWDTRYLHDDTQIFEKFVKLVDSQTNFNKEDSDWTTIKT